MTKAERARRTVEWCRDHEAEWAAYLAKPLAERDAMQQKVDAAFQQHGVQAARDMMRALEYPLPPDELCDPVGELEARQAAGDDWWMREAAARLGFSDAEIDAFLASKPVGRMDH